VTFLLTPDISRNMAFPFLKVDGGGKAVQEVIELRDHGRIYKCVPTTETLSSHYICIELPVERITGHHCVYCILGQQRIPIAHVEKLSLSSFIKLVKLNLPLISHSLEPGPQALTSIEWSINLFHSYFSLNYLEAQPNLSDTCSEQNQYLST
jgi:hypothetical protein